MTDRAALRQQLRATRRSLVLADRLAFQRAAQQHLLAWLSDRGPQHMAGYIPCGSELDLSPALSVLLARGHSVYLPAVVDRRGGRMVFRRWDGMTSSLCPDGQGILAPGADHEEIAPTRLDVVLVPGVGFAPDGHRLGSGAGYYDRAFAFRRSASGHPLLLGCGFAAQRIATLEAADWDVRMDALLDERGIETVRASPGRGGEP